MKRIKYSLEKAIEDFGLDKRRSEEVPCWNFGRYLVIRKLLDALRSSNRVSEENKDLKRIILNGREFCDKNELPYDTFKRFILHLKNEGFITYERVHNRNRDGKHFYEITMRKELTNLTFKIGKPKLKRGTRAWLRSIRFAYKTTKKLLEKEGAVSQKERKYFGGLAPLNEEEISTLLSLRLKIHSKRAQPPSNRISIQKKLEKRYGAWEAKTDLEGKISRHLLTCNLSRIQIGIFFKKFSAKKINKALKNMKFYTLGFRDYAAFLYKACKDVSSFHNYRPKHYLTNLIMKRAECLTSYSPWHRLKEKPLWVFCRFTEKCIFEAMNDETAKWKRNVVNPNKFLYYLCKTLADKDNSLYTPEYLRKQGDT